MVYDFMYVKDQEESIKEKVEETKKPEAEFDQFVDDSMMFELSSIIQSSQPSENSNCDDYSLIKELTSFYKTLIPGNKINLGQLYFLSTLQNLSFQVKVTRFIYHR